jgi:hypothetical protein
MGENLKGERTMASIEYITKRIEGKQAQITKLEKKLERILKAEATSWEVNPYYYSEMDKKYTQRDLETAKKDLEKLTADLSTANEKANSRNVKAILEFLENWKARVKAFYISEFPKYLAAREEWYERDRQYCAWWNNGGFHDPNRKEIERKHDEQRKDFATSWNFIFPYVGREFNGTNYVEVLDAEKLDKELKEEASAKYDDIIERTNRITGKITDAAHLEVGAKGELNGYIIGERGTAKVNTIGAGGYNIQCYHFRTLIHEA